MSFAVLPSSTELRVLEQPELGDVHRGAPPVPAAPLFGRQSELADLRDLVAQPRTRLITLTGPGGTGKSRLSLELAFEVSSAFGSEWFVDLTTVREAQLVPSAIAQAIGVQEGGSQPLRGILKKVLAGQTSLMLLDNFEHVLPAATFLADLLDDCPDLVAVVTSREALGLRAERVYSVGPLPVPDLWHLDDAEATRRFPSVVLFEERARARGANFKLTDQVLAAVADICVRLDGLPLAIELAAAQAAILSPAAILKRMEAGAPILGIVRPDLPARHQSIQATVAWSYDLLEPAEQLVFRTCGVFAAGFGALPVERLCSPLPDGEEPLAVLARLVSKSLLRVAEDSTDEPRFWMLETIREYALDQLAQCDELAAARAQHAAYYIELAEQLQHSLRGSDMAATLNELALDYANYRAIFQWALEVGDLDSGLRLAGALYRFWMARGPLTEARTWLDAALARSEPVQASIRAAALSAAGVLAGVQHEHARAIAYFQESLELWQSLGVAGRQAGTHLNLGLVAYITSDFEEAERHFAAGSDLYFSVGDRSGQARAVGHRARLAHEQNDLSHAMRLMEESLDLFQAADDDWGTAHSLANLGHLRSTLGDRVGAGAAFRQALEVWRALGNFVDVAECLEGMAAEVVDGQPRRAAHLFGAAEALRERSGAPIAAVEEPRYRVIIARLKTHLRENTFDAAWREGRGLSMDRAIELALQDDAPAPVVDSDGSGVLSPRELEIAKLIAQGSSNRRIADTLVVSVKTVETHIQHIFRKLEVKARSEIAVWATRHGLI
jgi:predicted ATPase/DNA-binding CsgD family transcriptional regulator